MPDNDDWLIGRLRQLVADDPDRELYIELADGENETNRLSAIGLAQRAAGIAARLAAEGGRPGDRVIVFDNAGLDTLAAFFGCLGAGIAPVVLPPARRPEHVATRLLPVAKDAQPMAVLTGPAADSRDQAVLDELGTSAGTVISLDQVEPGDPASLPHDPQHHRAFLQYTSGSTAAPRGVMIDHAQLMTNLEMIRRSIAFTPDTVMVSWNPLSHDMGLIIGAIPGVAFGTKVVLMPPAAFVLRPGRWLRAITRYRGTHGCGPNFAYELCIERIKEQERDALDLSSWRVALNGAEPVREPTRERFVATFGPRGFRPEAWCPAYGLAEATVFVSANSSAERSIVTWVDRRALSEHRFVARESQHPDATPVVGCGRPDSDIELAVVHPDARTRLTADEIGELWVSSPANAAGYFDRPDETAATFHGSIASEEATGARYLRTGDFAFIHAGQVHIVGRAKDLLIVNGRNIHAVDVELAAQDAHPAIRRGGLAAFAIDTGDHEEIVVVAEVNGEPEADEVAEGVRRAVFANLEVPVEHVVLTAPRGVPKTTSGKTQRAEARRLYLEGALPAPAPATP